MDSESRMANVAAALADTVERLAAEFPGGSALVERIVEAGREAAGDRALAAIDQALKALLTAGPEAWSRLAVEGRAILETIGAPAAEAHPLVRSARALLDEVAALAAGTATGASGALPDLDRVVMPLLDRLSSAVVDAMLGGRR